MEGGPKQFSSPEEEINFLRQQLAEKEREVLDRVPEIDDVERQSIARQQLKEYSDFTPKVLLDSEYQINDHELAQATAHVETSHDPVEDLLALAYEKGIKNTLTVLEKTKNAFVVDEVHRRLIEELHQGASMSDLKEGVPPWHILHMTLYEVYVPAQKDHDEREKELSELIGTMQQLFAGLRTIGSNRRGNHFTIEIAVADNSDDIIFYVAIPDEFKTLFEKQALSLFPDAILTIQPHDYNIYVNKGTTAVSNITLQRHYSLPLRRGEDFTSDPIAVILNAFSKIEREGGGAAIQFAVRFPSKQYRRRIEKIIKEAEKGGSPQRAIHRTSITGEVATVFSDVFTKKDENQLQQDNHVDQVALELFRKKIQSDMVDVNIRLVVSAKDQVRVEQIMNELRSTLNQFDMPGGNAFSITQLRGRQLLAAQKAFSFRQFSTAHMMPLSLEELATLVHFPASGISSTPQLKQSRSKTAPAPNDMPTEGTLLGKNRHREAEKEIFVTEKDRMRHFYIIGQTGTGKSVFMQNLIVQDIHAGHGVCMIDPHGNDIQNVLGAIPPERADDVIYFDPSNLDQVIGLNMLEYDVHKPEQKTFVVNELFSIFQKLYGANPESMGPMFEQYFRNATLLVMDHPESGNTLMDIGRVMADAKFRRLKLQHATNPVVKQFWTEIATKAGGEASLENIVPYIVSKFDVFTANDYMRPIIGQQESAFNFRQIMDEKKILLINLSKGRLGEINANLIGMIFVGKILMAALSRVDDPSMSFPPFFLHIDEFQNVSTPAIASILSEARKYKLGLVVAHQFIAQLDDSIRDAVFGNVGSMSVFRVGPEDAQFLEKQLEPVFNANDIMNIPNYQAYLKVLANGVPTQPFSALTEPPPESSSEQVAEMIASSLAKYARPRAEIEADIQKRYQKPAPGVPPAPPGATPSPFQQ